MHWALPSLLMVLMLPAALPAQVTRTKLTVTSCPAADSLFGRLDRDLKTSVYQVRDPFAATTYYQTDIERAFGDGSGGDYAPVPMDAIAFTDSTGATRYQWRMTIHGRMWQFLERREMALVSDGRRILHRTGNEIGDDGDPSQRNLGVDEALTILLTPAEMTAIIRADEVLGRVTGAKAAKGFRLREQNQDQLRAVYIAATCLAGSTQK